MSECNVFWIGTNSSETNLPNIKMTSFASDAQVYQKTTAGKLNAMHKRPTRVLAPIVNRRYKTTH